MQSINTLTDKPHLNSKNRETVVLEKRFGNLFGRFFDSKTCTLIAGGTILATSMVALSMLSDKNETVLNELERSSPILNLTNKCITNETSIFQKTFPTFSNSPYAKNRTFGLSESPGEEVS